MNGGTKYGLGGYRGRIRKQREYLGLITAEQFAENWILPQVLLQILNWEPRGMSMPTLCRIATTLSLSTDYILFGKQEKTIS